MLGDLRHQVWLAHLELPKNGLVRWTSGNVSARDPDSDLVVIKPSGVAYEDLRPENMVVVDSTGRVVEGDLLPSVDCESHLHIYRHRSDVNSVVHTHSPYATAFAAVGKSIPVVLTAIADEFGGPIPCAPYAEVGGDQIGVGLLAAIGTSPAVLMKNHGVFTVGPTARAAVKAAVLVEDAAKTVFLALQLGQPDELPAAEVARAHRRYLEQYGQPGAADRPAAPAADPVGGRGA